MGEPDVNGGFAGMEGAGVIYLWCPRKSRTAARIEKLFKEEHSSVPFTRVKTDGPFKHASGDLVVNWGSMSCPKGPSVLNKAFLADKQQELKTLINKGLPCPPYSETHKGEGWLARTSDHVDGGDLKKGLKHGDFYVKYVETTAEYRVHIFKGLSILLGFKEPRSDKAWKETGQEHHPSFRTYQLGWTIEYPKVSHGEFGPIPWSRRLALRKLGREAVAALGYDFGAVDIGLGKDDKIIVFEVNSAPGLEGCEIDPYVEAMIEAHKEIKE